MNKLLSTLAALLTMLCANSQTYNALWIPDTLSGTVFNLEMKDTTKQFFNGVNTATGGINSDFWGPTLFLNKGDTVHMHVSNMLMDSTTLHWHGMHLPPIMDGGPHQPIAPMTTWNPYWKVDNNAATYWYHPHMHMMAEEQITAGLGGFIIVRDSEEAALNLPRTYGVDDLPLALSDRRFSNTKQFVISTYGDSVIINGTMHPQLNVPAQVVRLRLLGAAPERSYNIGFSDNRNFSVIATDGGLLNAPTTVNRFLLSAGERVEILVDFSGQSGQSLELKAFNSTLQNGVPGFEPANGPPLPNVLGHVDFNLLHLNVTAATANPVTSIPATLTTNAFWSASSANLTRNLTITDSTVGGAPPIFVLNHRLFDMDYVDYNVTKNNTEIWQIASTSAIAHPFHIHDIEFYILSRNGQNAPAYEQGWKDVVLVKPNETVRFIAKFTDFADSLHPYMFHCHIAGHEDDGLMGQFIVTESVTSVPAIESANNLLLFPNPTNGKVFFDSEVEMENVEVMNGCGQVIKSEALQEKAIDLSAYPAGLYFIRLTDKQGNNYSTRIIKN